MTTVIEFLMMLLFIVAGGMYIGMAIDSFMHKRFFLFGIETMWALSFVVGMIMKVISWFA